MLHVFTIRSRLSHVHIIMFLFIPYFLLLVCTSHQHNIGHVDTFELSWWRKTRVPLLHLFRAYTIEEPPKIRELAGQLPHECIYPKSLADSNAQQ
jgi:hypothetical protein